MSPVFFQIWGGTFYLLNKICLWKTEHADTDRERRLWRPLAWSVYLIGLPGWIVVFMMNDPRNWIAAAIETGGAPAMVLGIIIALRGKGRSPRWLDWFAVTSVIVGLFISLYDIGGLSTKNQWLELGLAAGFLIGTYQLAHQRLQGYLWFMMMNVCCAALMFIQDYDWLMVQQIISLIFVADAFHEKRRREALHKEHLRRQHQR